MNIPEEAVEAAALVLYRIDQWGKAGEWPTDDQLAEGRSIFDPPPTLAEFKADFAREGRAVLEAAAPFIAATAWDEGFTTSVREQMAQDQDPTHPITRTNPYNRQEQWAITSQVAAAKYRGALARLNKEAR